MYTHPYQQSYNSRNLPQSWKHAIVCPICKKGYMSIPENYRPVTSVTHSHPMQAFRMRITNLETPKSTQHHNKKTKLIHGWNVMQDPTNRAIFDWDIHYE